MHCQGQHWRFCKMRYAMLVWLVAIWTLGNARFALGQIAPTSVMPTLAAEGNDNSRFTVPAGGSVGVPGGNTDASGGAGLFGIQYEVADSSFLSFLINVGTSQDLKGDQSTFGAALLNPLTQ